MNSHIQIPKYVFQEFLEKGKTEFYKYEVKKGLVSRGFPKTTFTSEGYFSEEMEKYLSGTIETPLKKLLVFARGLPEQAEPYIVSSDLLDVGKVYVRALIARNPLAILEAKKNMIYTQFASPAMTEQSLHDAVTYYAFNSKASHNIENAFDMSFMINRTAIPFVIPTRGLYEYSMNGVTCVNVPLTSWCALMLVEKGKRVHSNIKEKHAIMIIEKDDADRIERFNYFAMYKQISDKIGYVVCQDKKHLEVISEMFAH